tara:strand:- start:14287 stop:14868 length:582 start_codon:yes stop_codon:yes gene_type:complete
MTKKDETSNHYIDNKEFYAAMVEWKKIVVEAEESGEEKPPVTSYIGECFLKIATHLSYRPNFINYPFRDEMIGDGIENCLMYCSNFDPEKSKNPFSYFTQIIYYAFLRRIQKEKKQTYIKYKMTELHDIDGNFKSLLRDKAHDMENIDTNMDSDALLKNHFNLSDTDIEKFEPKKKKKKKTAGATLDKLLGDD